MQVNTFPLGFFNYVKAAKPTVDVISVMTVSDFSSRVIGFDDSTLLKLCRL